MWTCRDYEILKNKKIKLHNKVYRSHRPTYNFVPRLFCYFQAGLMMFFCHTQQQNTFLVDVVVDGCGRNGVWYVICTVPQHWTYLFKIRICQT